LTFWRVPLLSGKLFQLRGTVTEKPALRTSMVWFAPGGPADSVLA
jgi:hypothetical protein